MIVQSLLCGVISSPLDLKHASFFGSAIVRLWEILLQLNHYSSQPSLKVLLVKFQSHGPFYDFDESFPLFKHSFHLRVQLLDALIFPNLLKLSLLHNHTFYILMNLLLHFPPLLIVKIDVILQLFLQLANLFRFVLIVVLGLLKTSIKVISNCPNSF